MHRLDPTHAHEALGDSPNSSLGAVAPAAHLIKYTQERLVHLDQRHVRDESSRDEQREEVELPSARVDLGMPSAHAKTHVQPLTIFHPGPERPAQIFQDLETALVDLVLGFALLADLRVVRAVFWDGVAEEVGEEGDVVRVLVRLLRYTVVSSR